MQRRFTVLDPRMPVSHCAVLEAAKGETDFAVAVDGRLVGFLPRSLWQAAIRRSGGGMLVGEIMKKHFVCFSPTADLADAYRDLKRLEQDHFPVLQDGQVVGVLSSNQIRRMGLGQPIASVQRAKRGPLAGLTVDLG